MVKFIHEQFPKQISFEKSSYERITVVYSDHVC